MSEFVVPANVVEAVCQRWPDRGPAWLAAVDHELAELCSKYGAQPVEVMRARYGFVLAAVAPSGPLVFRGSPDPDAKAQAQVAETLADLGVAPRLHETSESAAGVWTVMDQVTPGTPLAELSPSSDIPDMLTAMLRPLVNQSRPISGLPSVIDWLRFRLGSDNLTDLPPGRQMATKSVRINASFVLDDLASSMGGAGLCHGDPSTRNILSDDHGRFLLVDPRGMVGEAAYDAAVVAIKANRLISSVRAAPFLARNLGLDLGRVEAWIQVANAARV